LDVVLGMDFGGTKIALAVCDLEGRCLREQKLPTGAEEGADAVLTRGISAARSLVALLEPGTRLAAVGVSTIGIPLENGVELAPAIPGWGNIAIGRSVEAAFGVPVRVATDVKAAATAEARWGSLAGYDPAIYLNLGTGLAAAIIAGGRVLKGSHGASGEIAYNLIDPSDVGVELSARPTLEDAVSGMGLAASGSRLLGRAVTAGQVFDAAPSDPKLDSIVSALIRKLSAHLINLVIAVDPARVAVGGGMVRSWERLQGPLEQALMAGVPFPPELVIAAYPYDAPLVGALALGAEVLGAGLSEGVRLPPIKTPAPVRDP
jgi:glucokinase